MIGKLINKIKNIVKIARIVSVDDSADVRFGVVKYLGKEQACQIFTPYGFASNPPENAMGPIFQVDGEESKLIGMFDRTDQRPVKDLATGEVVVGNYETGEYVRFKDGNIIEIQTNRLNIGNAAKSAAIADELQTLYNTLKTEVEKFNDHNHTDPVSGTTGGPNPGPSVPPGTVTISPSPWDANIASSKVKLPSN